MISKAVNSSEWKKVLYLILSVLMLLTVPTVGCAQMLDSLCNEMNFEARRLTSTDPEHQNHDFRRIEPGQTLDLGEMKGPGRIEHIWFTINAVSPDYLQELVLRIYWDGESSPAVECPLGDFFGLGFGKMVEYKSAATAIGSTKALNCYWPMPFAKSARFSVTNEGAKPVDCCYYNIDYRLDSRDRQPSGYFHTQYRQSYPSPKGIDYTVLDVRGRGQCVGCFLSLLANSDGWWGEGNDKFYVDGAEKPTIEGTGSEDYFCGAWNFQKAFHTDYCGVPYYEQGEKRGIRNTAYRWHILDPVPFKKSLKFNLEHGQNGVSDERLPLSNNYSTVAFYYVDHAGSDGPALPALKERMSVLLPLDAAPAK
jgi:hypothetical protein